MELNIKTALDIYHKTNKSKNISEPDYLLKSFAEKCHIDISYINKAALIAKLHRCKLKKKRYS